MSVTIADDAYPRLTENDLNPWRTIPSAVVCDALGRTGGMSAAIRPLRPGQSLVGQALTVLAPNTSNAAIHHAIECAWPGCVLVVDAGAREDKAVWGSVVSAYAFSCGVTGLVVDGCVRDAAILKQADLTIFCRGTAPNGPSKKAVGGIHIPIRCGGVNVAAGDLVIGDDDGVAVVPFRDLDATLEKCRVRLEQKRDWNGKTAAGVSTAALWELSPPNRKTPK
ncbi:MAG: RraA family protein [Rhodospirillales bacterium]